VRLADVGTVVDSVQTTKTASWFAATGPYLDVPFFLTVQRQPGTNTIVVVMAIKALLPKFRRNSR